MPVSVTMPRLGESVSEGTVTRWLKKEGEQVEADEPLLEVSTDKVDTEIPAPASGVLQSIKVSEDETVEVGAELAIIGEGGDEGSGGAESGGEESSGADSSDQPAEEQPAADDSADKADSKDDQADSKDDQAEQDEKSEQQDEPAAQQDEAEPSAESKEQQEQEQQAPQDQEDKQGRSLVESPTAAPAPQPSAPAQQQAKEAEGAPGGGSEYPVGDVEQQQAQTAGTGTSQRGASGGDGGADGGAYVTPLVRKLAAEHDVDLGAVSGTGVGGRIRKQDVLEAARSKPAAKSDGQQGGTSAPAETPEADPRGAPVNPAAAAAGPAANAPAPSPLRGKTEKMSRLRTVIAQRMVESLQVSAQLTTVVEVDVTPIAQLRERAKEDFAAREGVKLSFLPFFALAACEALKAHPNVNASIDIDKGEITYYDAEHLGIAVDTERGLLVPVIRNAGDLNLGGMARKIADLAERTRGNKITPDELGGGTFTLTNTGSRGALFDTPIINQPQVGILGTGSVVKRPMVVDNPDLGEVIGVRSMAYLSLTYDHRLVDGADAARFLVTVKTRLEEGRFAADLGLQ
jgi:2-oxoglutarate dehydrogenase E2 component (dihydrolipoamide succinyltransferase)